ncbi:alpha-L-rhamnosidase [Runella slithyformis]|uniref:alpha-L-rhamnosidase n=1 Tax=Runella slithyformis (strain ATCC 29530 / DSM 19594 / LMG 11500 / NCIMB 11436 / LSU 4) TaxID=761193 RepID=A0A7U3ZGW2_RUNSL|nr:alpha-L-rhamnosidase [Runella slithyformis]AEI46897.1 alpha-L-rhamnosidase [Runella slithyformis DSM 19594]
MKKIIAVTLFLTAFLTQVHAGVVIEHLKVNHQEKPLGTDIATPQFSWQMKATDAKRGYAQKAYRIVVKDAGNQVVWDSEKVDSDLSNGIEYAGTPLKATTRYTWKVTVWDNANAMASGSSWFETGLMNPGVSAWSGARWIGGGEEDMVFYSHYLSVFKFEYGLQLDKASNSTKAAFLFGGNDRRLMKKELNLMGVENTRNQSYIAFELDISGVNDSPEGLAKLHIYRVGYTPNDKADVPFKSLEIPQKLINNANKYEKHKIFADCNFGLFELYVDGRENDNKLKEKATGAATGGGFGARGINLNPVGSGNNYISFPMLADIGFRVGNGQTARFSDVTVKNYRFPSNALFTENLNSSSYTGIFKSADLTVENGAYTIKGNALILADPGKNAAPMLRTTFATQAKPIKSARLYVTARGIYEMYLNGQRVSNDYFNPGLTQYNKNHMYQTYDVTASLKQGTQNALGAWLSEGWWSGNITFSGENWNFFGDRQSLLSKLVVTYADGSQQMITSNPTEWKLFTNGPVRYGSFFQGEVYDASKEALIKDWSLASYNDSGWKSAVEVPLDGTAFKGTFTDAMGRKSSMEYNDFKLIGQMGDNPTIVKTLTARSVEEVRSKVFVYDMGQNMVGIPQIQIKNGKKGQEIILRYAEVKYPALPDYKGNEGMVMMENIRAALTQDTYILKGGDETIQPRFTFHGYRYVEITGIDQALPAASVKGLVISSIKGLSSNYETSNELVNKLWQNITWSLRSNFLSIPTDTPARNERMGWSGDISVFSRSATYLTDADLFLRRHLLAMRDVQAESGRFTDVAPMGGGFGGTLWGSAGIIVAWETYQQYGDLPLLKEHYDAMKKYVRFLDSKVEKNTGILNEGPLGDWLSPENGKNDNTHLWMAYYAYDLEIMAKVATALGKTEEAAGFRAQYKTVKAKFNEVYVDKTTHRTIKSGVRAARMGPPGQQPAEQKSDKGELVDTQVSYAVPLALNVFNEENKPYAIRYLNEAIQRKNKDDGGIERPEYSLMTGFIGTASISEALSQNGNHDMAYRLLQQRNYPSWLYSVVNGATSIWERLNSYTVENGFGGNNSMNSFNHYSFGAVASWMYNYSLGIQRSPEHVAFKQFILQPTPDPDRVMTFAKGYYDSVYGRITGEWKWANGKWTYKTTVPPNTSATLYLPAKSASQISESGKSIVRWKGMKQENGNVVLPLESGSYVFEITN